MKTVSQMAAQGDVIVRRVDKMPKGCKLQPTTGIITVSRSDSGHHHQIENAGVSLHSSSEELVFYIRLDSAEFADLVHKRDHDTHETLRLTGGEGAVWEARLQREWTPEGWRRASD